MPRAPARVSKGVEKRPHGQVIASPQKAIDPTEGFSVDVFTRKSTTTEGWRLSLLQLQLAGNVCGPWVKEHYLMNDAAHAATVLMLGNKFEVSRHSFIKNVRGFVLANDTFMPGFLYVDVICSKEGGLGKELLAEAEKYAREKNYDGLSLAALPHVVGYYHQLGFRNVLECMDANPELEELYRTRALPFVNRHKRDVAAHLEDKDEDAENYRAFLTELMVRGLVKKKTCTDLSSCGEHGYIMLKCFGNAARDSLPACVVQKKPQQLTFTQRLLSIFK